MDIHSWFLTRFDILFKDKDLKELKKKVENYDDKENLDEVTKKMNDIINESNNLRQKAQEEFLFYDKLLGNLLENNEYKNNIEGAYNKACDDIINSRIKSYIEYKKQLINLKDKIKELSSIFDF